MLVKKVTEAAPQKVGELNFWMIRMGDRRSDRFELTISRLEPSMRTANRLFCDLSLNCWMWC
jgi:hypothetical protein